MSDWKKYFSIIGYSRFVLPGIGEINAKDPNLSVEKVKKAYEKGCEFIIPTEEGIKKFYPHLKRIEPKTIPITKKKLNAKKTKAAK